MIGNDVVDLATKKKQLATKRVLDKILPKEQLLITSAIIQKQWFGIYGLKGGCYIKFTTEKQVLEVFSFTNSMQLR
jgi:hypothetical protein